MTRPGRDTETDQSRTRIESGLFFRVAFLIYPRSGFSSTEKGFLPREAAAKSGVELNSADNFQGMEFQCANVKQRLGIGRISSIEGSDRGGEWSVKQWRVAGHDRQGRNVSIFKTHERESFGNAEPGVADVSRTVRRRIMGSGFVEQVEVRQESGRRHDTTGTGPQTGLEKTAQERTNRETDRG